MPLLLQVFWVGTFLAAVPSYSGVVRPSIVESLVTHVSGIAVVSS